MSEIIEVYDAAELIARVCAALSDDRTDDALAILKDYRVEKWVRRSRTRAEPAAKAVHDDEQRSRALDVRAFIRDGFLDRYTGKRLVFPGTLRLISVRLGSAFPYHPNWKFDVGHYAYWELFPTIDHRRPRKQGGTHQLDSLLTTSMLANASKGDSLSGWEPLPIAAGWDGLMNWFLDQETPGEATKAERAALREWRKAAQDALVAEVRT
jgi:hypothetical protein